jgi:hypothetical protein
MCSVFRLTLKTKTLSSLKQETVATKEDTITDEAGIEVNSTSLEIHMRFDPIV